MAAQQQQVQAAQNEAAQARAEAAHQVAMAERTNVQTQHDAANFAAENLTSKENVLHEMLKDARASEDIERKLRQVDQTKMQINPHQPEEPHKTLARIASEAAHPVAEASANFWRDLRGPPKIEDWTEPTLVAIVLR